jgi:hypothetical protein
MPKITLGKGYQEMRYCQGREKCLKPQDFQFLRLGGRGEKVRAMVAYRWGQAKHRQGDLVPG